MSELADMLQRNGIDMTSLRVLLDRHGEEVHRLIVPGAEAFDLWQKLRSLVDETGHWPVLIGGGENLELQMEAMEEFETEPPSTAVAEGLQMEAGAWLRDRLGDISEDEGEDDDFWEEVEEEVEQAQATLRDRPLEEHFSIPRNTLTREHHPEVCVALVPAVAGWKAPAYLSFGGWNACPYPHEHIAVMKYWQERYGAEVVGISHDVVEMLVARPPQTPEEAMALAKEQMAYCDDIVYQGTATLQRLADGLASNPVWYFWWD